MNYKILALFFAFLVHKHQIYVESMTCEYSLNKVYINNKVQNKYSCKLSSDESFSNENENEIIGNHLRSNTDGNVEVLQSSTISNLESLSSLFCDKFSNIEVIKLQNVKINSIDDDAFQKCTNLKILYLNSDGIYEIPENLMSENTELIEIEIMSNNVESLPEDVFEMQENLKKLYLQNNKIKFLPGKIFKPLKNLVFLNLNNNKIKVLNSKLFQQLENLQKLSLNSNNIAVLPRGVFSNLNLLRVLELNSNQLSVINSNSFGIHSQLTYVDFNDNKISAVDPAFFIRGPINPLKMEGNQCLNGIIQYRQDDDLGTCYFNFKNEAPITSTELLTRPETSTTTSTTTKTTRRPSTRTTTTPKPSTSTIFPFKPEKIAIQYTKYSDGEYPWIAAIMLSPSPNKDSEYKCGGVLVTDTKIVTAASCLYSKSKNRELFQREIQIVLGSRKIFQRYETGKLAFAVYRFRVHPSFSKNDPLSSANIAVLFLENPVKINKFIKPIGLNRLATNPISVTNAVYVTHGSKESLTLKSDVTSGYLQASIFNNRNCQISKKDELFCISDNSEDPLCVDVIGSGLFVKQSNQFYLRGILTSVAGSCDFDSYSLFTDVSKYITWIENVIPEDPEELEFNERIWTS